MQNRYAGNKILVSKAFRFINAAQKKNQKKNWLKN